MEDEMKLVEGLAQYVANHAGSKPQRFDLILIGADGWTQAAPELVGTLSEHEEAWRYRILIHRYEDDVQDRMFSYSLPTALNSRSFQKKRHQDAMAFHAAAAKLLRAVHISPCEPQRGINAIAPFNVPYVHGYWDEATGRIRSLSAPSSS